jgi:hypothetical protein
VFVQLFFGEPADADGLARQWHAWTRDLAPGATGWLGSTGGVSQQGSFCGAARFESEASARANSDRPEQGEWWKATDAMFSGPVTFVDSSDVTVVHGGGSDDAGFVQLMRATCSDRARLEALEAEVEDLFQQWRPDFIGGLRVWEPGGTLTGVDYFTSVEEARAGEASAPPPGLAEKFGEWQGLLSEVSWYDITDPWCASP